MAYGPSKSRKISKKEPKEPNLIPIMNLFIVVIPMLMTMMVSVHLAMLEITLPVPEGGGGGQENTEQKEEPPKEIVLGLFPNKFEINIEDDEDVIQIPVLDDSTVPALYNYTELNTKMAEVKKEHQNQETVKIIPDPKVKYDTLLRAVDICKSNGFPKITYSTILKKFYRAGKK